MKLKVSWDSLPVDLWHYILQQVNEEYFESISLTCKLFLSITDRLRSTLTISNQTIATHVLRRCPNIKRINVHPRLRGDIDCLIRDISASGVTIEAFDLSHHPFFPSSSMREVGANHLLWKKTLKVLNCSKIQSLSDWDLTVISESFPALEELDISKEIDHEGFGDHCNYQGLISDDGIKALVLNLAQCLRKINVSGNHMITDESLYALSWNCPSLSEVHVQDCGFTTEYGIASVITQRPMLRAISIASALQRLHIGKTNISDDILFSIARLQLKELRIPYCWGFSITGLVSLLRALPSLSHLDLSGCVFLTDKSMALIAPHLREVTTIDLSYCSELTELTFMCLVNCCPLLEEVRMKKTDLGRCGTLHFTSMKNRSKIRTLDLSRNRHFNDETLIQISSVCPELRMVDLTFLESVTETGITQLGLNCPHIRTLNVTHCCHLTGLGNMGFHELETLKASYSRIEDEGLVTALRRCGERLRVVDLKYSQVTKHGMIKMVNRYPRLRKVNQKWYCDFVKYIEDSLNAVAPMDDVHPLTFGSDN
ncbi:hypothetical protein QJS04_geneDACA003775 [Acorus gramineus]|uniref:F-box domain-containing protein n=1 Tax=Acorus gramineus TaxID=55184 RepID=A0AAV9BIU6_ACOGR|nr:hypothetical protein QJS04_geneDACA003775 [Acorus gramineus]